MDMERNLSGRPSIKPMGVKPGTAVFDAAQAGPADSGITVEQFKQDYRNKVERMYGDGLERVSDLDKYNALVSLVRDYLAEPWLNTKEKYRRTGIKQVYYFSIEFLLGRLLGSNLYNLGLNEVCQQALGELGLDLRTLRQVEEDPGLGNGGLGRLAACYLDSMASLGLPGHGMGMRYRYGLFEQWIVDGYQREYADDWLMDGFYWDVRKPAEAVEIRFGGSVRVKSNGKTQYIHEGYETVLAVPYDVPVVGYRNGTVNTLRLWSAEARLSEVVCAPQGGSDCQKAVEYSQTVEELSNILYPDDSTYEGKALRLKQQYFLVSAGLQSIIRNYRENNGHLREFSHKIAIHINDTHPVLCIPELLRILLDEEQLTWEEAWNITVQTMSYTNHTILPEALETWPEDLFRTVLPRLYLIVRDINEYYCRSLWEAYPGDWDRISRMAIISYNRIHMAHLAIAGCHSVNGVAELHTDILKNKIMKEFCDFSPAKFNNKTNGVTQRRWVSLCNPALAQLITDTIGPRWVEHPQELAQLERHGADTAFQHHLLRVKLQNKVALAKYVKEKHGITLDVNSIFDSQIKRIHAYKRQTLNVLHIMALYNRLKENPLLDIEPHTFIFGGKAAVNYHIAKNTIKLINSLADLVNNDKSIRDKIKVVFLENYNVSLAELIIPATDVSEQIPTASYEASGTGNMKFMMNGAVTIGTLDGANIEIKQAVGEDNIIVFGLTAEEVLAYYRGGGYNPWEVYQGNERLRQVVDQLINGFFPGTGDLFRGHFDSLLYQGDHFFVLKDFASYEAAHRVLDERYKDRPVWLKMCSANIAHSGRFSSDRTFAEYATDIWHIRPDTLPFSASERKTREAAKVKKTVRIPEGYPYQ